MSLALRRHEYTQPATVRIKVGSWNVAACPGTEYDVTQWFLDDEDIDIYVLGLQEIVDLASTKEYLTKNDILTEKWRTALNSISLRLVSEQQYVGLLLLIYAKEELSVTATSTTVGTGMWGYLGNKGAVTTEVTLGETTKLAFINSHLSSGADAASLERRCWDAGQIVSRTSCIDEADVAFWFGDLNFRLSGLPGEDIRRLLHLHTSGEYKGGRNEELEEDPVVVGESEAPEPDLPDPEDFDDPHMDPSSLQSTLDSLLSHDELLQVQKDRCFQDWREGAITFLPTYKYDVGTVSRFDSSEKKRAPSWCDRILYRTQRDQKLYKERQEHKDLHEAVDDESILFDYDYDPDEDAEEEDPDIVTLESYTSHQRITSSDHKPLSAIFQLRYDRVVPELKAKVQAEIARELDRAENEARPGITIVAEAQEPDGFDGKGVMFGDIGYLRKKTRFITIANTSQVPAKFSFVAPPDSEEVAPKWLKIIPAENLTLEPGDTLTLTLEAYLETPQEGKLDDVLILRVIDGRDHFIRLIGRFLPTCFGRSIDELIRIPEGGARNNKPGEVCWSAPRELFKLTETVESLAERVVADSQMLDTTPPQVAGWPFEAWSDDRESLRGDIIDALEQDKPLTLPPEVSTTAKLETVCETLILFLGSLKDGIVTEEMWTQIDNELKLRPKPYTEEDKTHVLDMLATSPNHNISLVFLTAMLSKLAAEMTPVTRPSDLAKALRRTLTFKKVPEEPSRREEVNKRFAEILAPIIFRIPEGKDKKASEDRAKALLEVFLKGNAHS